MYSEVQQDGGAQTCTNDKEKIEYPMTTITGKSFGEVEHIVNADKQYLLCRYWKAVGEPKALMFHVHGYAEHCGRSKELAGKLAEIGVYSFAHDHVGHGDSEGIRGHIPDHTVLVRDVLQHVELMKSKFPDLPMFYYGHSMGGALAVLAAQEKPEIVKGVLLSAPLITLSPDTATPIKVFLAKIIVNIMPKLRVGKINTKWLSRNKEEVKAYREDPMIDVRIRASMATQFLVMTDRLKESMKDIEWPLFLAHSQSDRMCDIEGSKLLFEVCKSKDKTFKVYDNAMHMLEHEEPDFVESYTAEVVAWVKERI